jgi:hypothetical protein
MDLVWAVAIAITLVAVAELAGFPALDWFADAVAWVQSWAQHMWSAIKSKG